MPTTTSNVNSNIQAIVTDFVGALSQAIEQDFAHRVLRGIGGALPTKRGPGRPSKSESQSFMSLLADGRLPEGKPRKKAPKQLCPVPGCKNPAAPIFGMVCAKHKDLPKTKIKAFREKRRAAKK